MNNLNYFIQKNGLDAFKKLAYHFTSNYNYKCILDSCRLKTGAYEGKYEFLAAFGAEKVVQSPEELEKDKNENNWFFGVIGYDLKNKFEDLSSLNSEIIHTPKLLFFVPKIIIGIDHEENVTLIKGVLPPNFWHESEQNYPHRINPEEVPIIKEDYLKKIKLIHELIREGEVYELNYCVPHKFTYEEFSPINFHIALINKSPVPMAAYFGSDSLHLCGASMERYLVKKEDKILSQPIKGTIKKGETIREDQALIATLLNSEKDRAENVMIVDLVRNDLNKICQTSSVKVTELCEIYSYLQVHQMISTVEGKLNPNTSFTDILRATFPMGSMTGAPKIAAMKHIDELESFKRGWYSGSVGYIQPNGDFDFNVVIRSLLCDEDKKILNYCAGGAITIDSNPENEWDEIQVKTKAITEVLND
ncbi:MAG: anthranilate synthase component I family protein [Bacteroidia bacterium]|nr:anthranilate synthase component I family protein [Bacteroidia bacterium]